MSEVVVLDSSAVLCLINDEAGADAVAAVLARSVISAVNAAEIVGKLSEKGFISAEIDEILRETVPDVRPFTRQQAIAAGELRRGTRLLGLSLGDRACLALAVDLKAVVMTCDRAWAEVDPHLLGGAVVQIVR